MTGTSAISQVGIYTELPNATLDVAAKPTDLTKADGIIAPKLKGSELKAKDNLYNTLQAGAIVYISEPLAAAETSSKTTNVTSTGYFFFNGNRGQKTEGSTGLEPWNVAGTTTPTSVNSQDIYQMGKVFLGKNSGQSSLDISGSFRSDDLHSGSVCTYSSILGGNTNQVTAVNSIILGGVSNIASAAKAVAGGNNSQSSGYASFSFGSDVITGASKQFTVGYFNAFTDGTTNNGVLTDALFQVGNGGGPINRRNAFTILKN